VKNLFKISYLLKQIILLVFIIIVNKNIMAQTIIQKVDNGYQLIRDGKPYYVKGVGGQVNFDDMVRIGANSFRMWGIEDAQTILDEAQKKGLTVMLGFWMQHERHGFDYNNTAKVKNQLEHFKQVVNQFKNHPALLMWGIGNELDLEYTNPNCWNAVQDIAKYCHEVDPNHPTSTVTAGLDSLEVDHIKKRCPDIDIYCVNTYGDIGNVPSNIGKFGWTGPYMITEWGPNGHWESPNTNWGVALEQSSTEKREVYEKRFSDFIAPNKSHCLGSYAFLWGAKQEYTETWYGLYSKENLPTEPIDALEKVFTDKTITNPSPSINGFTINNKLGKDNIILKADEKCVANLLSTIANNTNATNAKFRWRIMQESTDKKSGGDKEDDAAEISGLIKKSKIANEVNFYAPTAPGLYRLFVSVTHNGKVAYSNIPFKVIAKGPYDTQSRAIQLKYTDMNSFDQ
jgi:Glycosyl hydrolases family 2, TIM barrel domain